ncbi:MAG TPA: META domain-containing protein [Cellvibrio sp.]|nr:META domain-containing protein [Cellvibrio sp.]
MMNLKMIGALSAIVLSTTACSPKQDNTGEAASSVATISSTVTSSLPTANSEPSATQEPTNPVATEFLNTYWKLTVLNDTEVTVVENQQEPHIVFDADNRVSGSDGCNRLMGTYTRENDQLDLGEIAGTKMACAQGGEQADAFIKVLEKVKAHSIHADQLELRDETGLVIARFAAVALP